MAYDRAREPLTLASGAALRGRPTFALRIGDRDVPLYDGEFIVGRNDDSDVQIDGPLVSRYHARITVDNGRVTIEDLVSRNGVFVNGVLVKRPVPLEQGDHVKIGGRIVELVALERRDSENRVKAGTIPLIPRPPLPAFDEDEDSETTTRADPLELLRSIVDRALADGETQEAEALVSGHLAILLGEARIHRYLKLETCDRASRYALKLASSTGKSSWIDYIFELFFTARQLVPLSVVDELLAMAPRVRFRHREKVRLYLEFLRANRDTLGPEQEPVMQKLEKYARD